MRALHGPIGSPQEVGQGAEMPARARRVARQAHNQQPARGPDLGLERPGRQATRHEKVKRTENTKGGREPRALATEARSRAAGPNLRRRARGLPGRLPREAETRAATTHQQAKPHRPVSSPDQDQRHLRLVASRAKGQRHQRPGHRVRRQRLPRRKRGQTAEPLGQRARLDANRIGGPAGPGKEELQSTSRKRGQVNWNPSKRRKWWSPPPGQNGASRTFL